MKKVVVGWSGGKDSAWMLHKLKQQDDVEIGTLLTVTEDEGDDVVLTLLNRRLIREQAAALGLPLIESRVVGDVYREFFRLSEQTLAGLVRQGYTHIAFGDISNVETRSAREEFLKGKGLEPIFPLWGRNDRELSDELIAGGIKALVVAIDPERVDPALVGHTYDKAFTAALRDGVDHCGEYEEFQTFAYDSPDFSSPLNLMLGDHRRRSGYWLLDVYLSTP